MKRAVTTTLATVAVVLLAVTEASSAQEPKYGPVKTPTRSVAEKFDTVRPMITDGHSFLEVNTAGELVRWTRTADGATFDRQMRGIGWQTARLITSLSDERFVEIKTDGQLAEWNWVNGSYQQSIVGTGWQGSRAITGLDDEHFLEIKPNNDLALWSWTASGYQQTIVGTGWHTARLIAGLNSGYFLEVKTDGRLAEWYWDNNGYLQQNIIEDSDFSDLRLIVSMDIDHWALVDYPGNLREYVWEPAQNAYVPYLRNEGWQTTRLLG